MEIADKMLGTLANLLQVAAAITAIAIFLTSRKRAEAVSGSILSIAEWAAGCGWLKLFKRASVFSYLKFKRFYGSRNHGRASGVSAYLTTESFDVSLRLVAIYLALGSPFVGLLLMIGNHFFDAKASTPTPTAMIFLLIIGFSIVYQVKGLKFKKAKKRKKLMR